MLKIGPFGLKKICIRKLQDLKGLKALQLHWLGVGEVGMYME